MLVYIQDKKDHPLMPTKRLGKVRRWLKSGRAAVVRYGPFTIRLLDVEGGYTQPLEAGVDLGTAHVGVSVVSEAREVFVGEFKLRVDISKLLATRRMYRRSRRGRKTRYRKARFLNRKRQDELSPSMRARVEETFKIINLVGVILPITHWTFEIGNFDSHKLVNPDVEGEDYQRGEQHGFWNVREYVLWRDRHTCQACKGHSKDPVLNVHHIDQRQDGGSDRPGNLITLCRKCHRDHHSGATSLTLKAPKSLKSATQFNIIKAYVMRQTVHLERSATFGYLTKSKRIAQGLSRSHINDAFVIAGGNGQVRAPVNYLGLFARRQNRKLFKGARSHIRNTIPSAKGFKRGDRVRLPDGERGFIYGLRSSGYFDVRRLNGAIFSHSISWKKLHGLEGARTLRFEALTSRWV
jgi:hypothetical protein